MRDGICLSYLRNTLFDTDPRDEPAGIPAWVGFRAADDVDEESGLPRLPLSLQCLQALAKAHLGRVQGAPGVSREGSRLYVASLARLNRELRLLRAAPAPTSVPPDDWETSTLAAQRGSENRNRNRNKSESPSEGEPGGADDNVLAILILGAYEMFVLSSSTGWIDHALGLGSVLEMRGPHAFVAGVVAGVVAGTNTNTSANGHNSNSNSLAHTLLESSRFLIILASLAVSKRTFLSRDEWKTIPWSRSKSNHDKIQHPGETEAEAAASKSKRKSPANMLLDIFADLPGLKEQRERERGQQRGGRGTRHDEDSRPCGDDDLRTKASNIINDLLSWRRMWDSSPEGQITTKYGAVDAVLSSPGASREASPGVYLPRAAASPSPHFKFFDSTVLTFTSTHAANCTCLYDAALIMAIELFLTTTTPGIDQGFPPRPPPPPPSAPPPRLSSASSLSAGLFERSHVDDGDGDEEDHHDDDVVADDEDARMLSLSHTAAVEICRSIPFQLSRTSSLTGQFLVLYPLRMAWKAFGGDGACACRTTTTDSSAWAWASPSPSPSPSRWVQDLLDDFGKDPRNRWGVLRQTLTSWH
ncbi:hypothetical protein LTS15_004270 [Exophiala xenobiotica]|nr:hypothetical protein LTS15_004270 [Exophiala xenobiotica]